MSDKVENKAKLELIAHKSFSYCADMYKVIDFLNKSIKDKNIILGLTKDKEHMIINIYET